MSWRYPIHLLYHYTQCTHIYNKEILLSVALGPPSTMSFVYSLHKFRCLNFASSIFVFDSSPDFVLILSVVYALRIAVYLPCPPSTNLCCARSKVAPCNWFVVLAVYLVDWHTELSLVVGFISASLALVY